MFNINFTLGNIHNVSVSVQNSKQTSNNGGGVITNNGGVITLAGYTAANLPPLSTLTQPLVQAGGVGGGEVGGGEGLVEQLEISLLQEMIIFTV